MGDTTIQWAATPNADGTVTPGKTWNPLRGCSRESTGCERCYAERIAARYSGPGQAFEGFARMKHGEARWTGKVATLPDKLREPLTWRKPTTVFVNSMSDLFHEDVPLEFIAGVFGVMARASAHTFQVLTKRAGRMVEFFEMMDRWSRLPISPGERAELDPTLGADRRVVIAMIEARRRGVALNWPAWWVPDWPLPNVWLGVSCENQATADERIPHLLRTPAAVRFLSCEPLLGPVSLWPYLAEDDPPDEDGHIDGWENLERIHWVIAGSESGQGARPADLNWFRALRDECELTDTKFFLKQFATPSGHKIPLPELDGRTWREWPTPEPAR